MTGLIGIIVLLGLMALGMPIGFSMMLLGFAGFTYLVKLSGAFNVITTIPFATISNYDYCVLPLFVLMAAICLETGLGKSLFLMVYTWIGRLQGGLAVATIGACALFAAASASSIATAVTIGTVAIPEMRRYKYDLALSTGCVAAGGTLGILIPPSGTLIIYGIITQQSISKLFIAGILPGITLAFMFMVMIYIRARLNPNLAPAGPSTSFKEKLSATGQSAEMIALLLLVIIGLIVGLFTPTEAGAIGAFGAIVFSMIRRRLSWQGFKNSILDTLQNTGMIFVIMVGALIFNAFLAVSTIPMELASWITGFNLSPLVVMIVIIVIYIVLGCFIDAFSMVLLTVPIFYHLVTGIGFDPIWFGIIIVLVTEMAMITPPVGINVYVISGITRDAPMATVFRGITPFAITMVIFLIILIAFPQVALVLPSVSG
jgi:tripartite ATP-independent transporter DctM subunit